MRWIGRLSLCALLAGAAGCMRYQPVGVPAPEASGRAIRQARVTTVESAYFVLRDVRVTADSVTGWHEVTTNALLPPNRQRIALHRIQGAPL